jgi:sec-independent protein translocase protein TatB
MEFLGIGPLELFFILIIALIVLGPRDMVKTGRTLGKYLRKIVMSPTWRTVQQTSRELRTLPNRMIREAGMEEDIKDLDQLRKDLEKQVGSISKPFSTTAGELNQSMRAVTNDLTSQSTSVEQDINSLQSDPAVQTDQTGPTGLSAWTTPPPEAEPVAGAIDEQTPGSASAPDKTAAAAEDQNPKQP